MSDTTTEFPHRRAADSVASNADEDILRLIQSADEAVKPMLIVLYQINKNLTSNTTATVRISDRIDVYERAAKDDRNLFADHCKSDEKLFNQATGAWKVLAGTMGAIVVLGGYIFNGKINEQVETAKLAQQHAVTLQRLESLTDSLQSIQKRDSALLDRVLMGLAPVRVEQK